MHSRRAVLGGLLGLAPSIGHALAQTGKPEPHAIVEAILAAYRSGKPRELAALPLVFRLKAALAKADLGPEIIIDPADGALTDHAIGAPTALDNKRITLMATLTLASGTRQISFDFDRTSGDWLITDIRPHGRQSLRQWLIPPSP